MDSGKTVSDTSLDLAFGSHISSEEKTEILAEIEEAVSASKTPITESAMKLNPVKKGLGFPMVINILMLLAVVASFFTSRMLFEQRQGELSQETQFYLSAEGKLLEELRRESEEALQEKDQQIGAIQEELAELDRRSSELSANMEATINAREQELRREMEASIATERERLAGAGSSQEEIQAKLEEMQSQLENQNNEALDSFRASSERALQEQRRELEQTIALNQSLLEDANAEKIRLEEESQAREAEMASQFEEEKAVLEASTREAQAALSNLAALQEQQYLLDDQVTGAYSSIIEQINTKDYDEALQSLDSLRSLLTSENVQAIPAYAKKRPVDLYILETLRNQIETTASRAEASTSSLAAAADLLLAAEELAVKGLEAYSLEDTAAAYAFLTQAVVKIPKIGESYETLSLIEAAALTEKMETFITNAEELSRVGNFTAAIDAYINAVEAGSPENAPLALASLTGIINLYDNRHAAALSSGTEALTALRSENVRAIASLKRAQDAAMTSLQERHENAVDRIDRENRAALSALREEKETEITDLQQKIAEQETALALQKIALADAETALLEASAASDQEVLALQERLAGNKDDLAQEYTDAMAEIEAGYQTSLEDMKTRHQEALTSQNEEHTAAVEALKAAHNTALAAKDAELEERDQNIFTLSASVTEKEESLAELETLYAGLQEDYESQTSALESTEAASTEMSDKLAAYSALAAEYQRLKSRMERLMNTGNPNDFFQAEELLLDFLDSNMNELLPGAPDIIRKTAEALISTTETESRDEGLSEGREKALSDILEYTGYLAAGETAAGQESLLDKLKTRVEEDSSYARVVKEIEDLIIEGAALAAQATSVLGRPQLLGTVSRVSGNTIIIETLADLTIEEGMEISVRRKDRRSDEVVLATGEITSISSNYIEAEVHGSLGSGRVEIADFVYVTLN